MGLRGAAASFGYRRSFRRERGGEKGEAVESAPTAVFNQMEYSLICDVQDG